MTDGSQPRIYYGYWIAGAAVIAWFVTVATAGTVSGVFLKPMTEELGWTRAEFFIADTVGRFLLAFVGAFIGVYVDRFGGRVLMVVGTTIVGLSLFMVSEVSELWQWVLVRGVLFFVGSALMSNLVVTVTLSKWFVEKRGRVVAIASLGVPLGISLGSVVLIFLVDSFGWRAAWRLTAIGVWVLVYPVAMVMRRQPEDHGLHPDGRSADEVRAGAAAMAQADLANSFTRGQAVRTRALYLIIIAFGFASLALGTLLAQTIPFLTDEGFSRGTAALMLSAYGLTSALSKPPWGYLMDTRTPRFITAAGFAMMGVSVFVVMVGTFAESVPIVFGGYLLFGAGGGGIVPFQEVIWASYFGRRHLGAVRGVAMPPALALSAGGPIAVAFYFDVTGSYYGALGTVGALSVVGAFVILLATQPRLPTFSITAPGEPSDGPSQLPAGGAGEPSPSPVTTTPVAGGPEAARLPPRPLRPRSDYMQRRQSR